MRFVTALAVVTLLWGSFPAAVFAHPGGTDAKGCHNNRKTGDYHCHTPKRAAPPPGPSSGADGEAYFANCTEARRAGRVNIRRGEPGYRPELDRDNDGYACEPYRGR